MESELLISVMLTDLPAAALKTCSCLVEQTVISCMFVWAFVPGNRLWRHMRGPAGVKGLVPYAGRCMFSCMRWLFETIRGFVLSFPWGPFFHHIWRFLKRKFRGAGRQPWWSKLSAKRCSFFRFFFLRYTFYCSNFTDTIIDVHRSILARKRSTSVAVFYCWWNYY